MKIDYVRRYNECIGIIVGILECGAYTKYIEDNGSFKSREKLNGSFNKVRKIINAKENDAISSLNYDVNQIRNKLVHQAFDFEYLYKAIHASNAQSNLLTDYVFTIAEYIGYNITKEEIFAIWEYIYFVVDTGYEKFVLNTI